MKRLITIVLTFLRKIRGDKGTDILSSTYTYSLSECLRIASLNGFVITEESIFDSTNCMTIVLDYKYAEETCNKDSFAYKNWPLRVIKNRAIRHALSLHKRFTNEVLPKYKPNYNF